MAGPESFLRTPRGASPTVEVDGEHVRAAGLVLDEQPVIRPACSRSRVFDRAENRLHARKALL